jgi:uncharacterized membrane protein
LVLLGATCFVVNAGVSKVAMSARVDAPRLSSIRCAGTAAGLLLLALVTGRASALPVRRDELPLLLTYGVAGVAMLRLTYFVAIDRLPVGVALLLQYLAPLLIALWARLVTREPVRRTVWFALGLSLVGLALVGRVWDGAFLDPVGVVAGIGAAVSFTTYFLAGERGLGRRDPVTFSFWGFFLGSLFWSALRPWWTLDRAVVGGQHVAARRAVPPQRPGVGGAGVGRGARHPHAVRPRDHGAAVPAGDRGRRRRDGRADRRGRARLGVVRSGAVGRPARRRGRGAGRDRARPAGPGEGGAGRTPGLTPAATR